MPIIKEKSSAWRVVWENHNQYQPILVYEYLSCSKKVMSVHPLNLSDQVLSKASSYQAFQVLRLMVMQWESEWRAW